MTLAGWDIVCVGFSDWNADVLTNQQHLLARAAERNRILFVESLGLRRPQLAGGDLRRMAGRLARGLTPPREVDGVHILSPLVLPLHSNVLARWINAWLLPHLVARAAGKLGLREPVLWSFVPQAEVLVDRLKPSKILYYIDDDHAAKPGIDAASFAAAENRFARRADVVLASAPELVQRMQLLNGNVHYAPNVADTRLFATALEPGPVDEAMAALPSPRVLFIGAILAATIDIELVVELHPQPAGLVIRLRRTRGPRRSPYEHRSLAGETERAPAGPASARPAAQRAARRRGRDHPLPSGPTDGERLPDEDLRVPRRRAPRRHHAAPGSGRCTRRRPGRHR